MKAPLRIVISVLISLLVVAGMLFFVWCTGFNFDHRGETAAMTALTSMIFGAIAFYASNDLLKS